MLFTYPDDTLVMYFLSATASLRSELFGDGQQGVMYVPRPVVDGQQVLYVDRAGTTAAVDNDRNGLMLDMSRGLVLGPDLIVNGRDWTGAAGNMPPNEWAYDGDEALFSIIDGALFWDRNGDGPFDLRQTVSTTAGVAYVFECDLLDGDGGRSIRITTTDPSTDISGEGKKRVQFVATGSATVISFRPVSATNQIMLIDNISVRELPGSHAVAPSDAARPLHSDTPPLQVYDDVDDEMDVILPSIAAATIATATPSGVVIDYPVDLSGGSYTIDESHSGIIIREGELTANEQQKVTDYLNQLSGA